MRLFRRDYANFSNNTNSSNCNEFSAEEQRTLNTIVISVSSTASLACILAILFILLSKGHKKFVQRLVLYLMVAVLVEAVASILQVVPVQYNGNVGEVRKGLEGFCAAAGFFYPGCIMAGTVCDVLDCYCHCFSVQSLQCQIEA